MNKTKIAQVVQEDLEKVFGNMNPLDFIVDADLENNFTKGDESNGSAYFTLLVKVPKELRAGVFRLFSSLDNCRQFITTEQTKDGLLETHEYNRGLSPVDSNRLDDVPSTSVPQPAKVYYNGNHTCVVWADGTKTVVGTAPGEAFDEYAGFCAAVVKKLFGSSKLASDYLDLIKEVQT